MKNSVKRDLSNNIVAEWCHAGCLSFYLLHIADKILIVLEKIGHVSKVPFKGSSLCNG